MKRIILYALCALSMAGIFVSCKSDEGLTPDSVRISGKLGKYFTVVDRNYKVDGECVTVDLQRNDRDFPESWEELIEDGDPLELFDALLEITFLNAEGLEIDSDIIDIESNPEDFESLFYAEEDEIVSLTFAISEKGAKTFKIGSDCEMDLFQMFGDASDSVLMEIDSLATNLTDSLENIDPEALEDDLSRFVDDLESAVGDAVEDLGDGLGEILDAI